MDKYNVLYFCDPQKNTPCRRNGCALYGGRCYSTSKVEYALLYANGAPRVITPKQQMEMDACRAQIDLAQKMSGKQSQIMLEQFRKKLATIEIAPISLNDKRRAMGLWQYH